MSLTVAAALLILAGLIVLLWGLLNWLHGSPTRWERFARLTGFVGYPREKLDDAHEYVPGKTLWDFLELLLVPVTLTVGVLLFNNWADNRQRERDAAQRVNDQKAATQQARVGRQAARQQARVDRQVVIKDQRERALQSFFDEMSRLVLEEDLRRSRVDSDLRIVARTRALSTLARLDGERKGSLVRFLAESRLLKRPHPPVSLRGADLSGALMEDIDLNHASLQDVTLNKAELSGANLRHADFTGADVEGTCLANAHLDYAIFDHAFFVNSYMYNVTLNHAGTREQPDQKDAPPGFVEASVVFLQSFLVDAEGIDTKFPPGSFNGALITDGTKIEGADLSGAQKLSEKDLESDFEHERWHHCWPPHTHQ